jgi:hypothetical protein
VAVAGVGAVVGAGAVVEAGPVAVVVAGAGTVVGAVARAVAVVGAVVPSVAEGTATPSRSDPPAAAIGGLGHPQGGRRPHGWISVRSRSSPRWARDLTVPGRHPSTSAISASLRSA